MPVEIRELIIRTEIFSSGRQAGENKDKETLVIKKQVLEDCKRLIAREHKRTANKR